MAADIRPPSTAAPLSFAQERLWFLERLDPGSPAYNLSFSVPIPEAASPHHVAEALRQLVRRHAVLRIRITQVGDEARQVVTAVESVEPLARSIGPVTVESAAEFHERIAGFFSEPFDLVSGPVFRARVVGDGGPQRMLLVVVHHIAADGWSIELLRRELAGLLAGGHGAGPDRPPVWDYFTYAAEQRRMLAGAQGETLRTFWRDYLLGIPSVTELPTDWPRPKRLSAAGFIRWMPLDPALVPALRHCARAEATTPFTVLLAAFSMLLWRWSGQRDLVIGIPVAGRSRAESEGVVGLFVNTLPIRLRLDQAQTFRGWVQSVHEAALAAYAHAEYPFERIVNDLVETRDTSSPPLVQLTFAHQPAAWTGAPAASFGHDAAGAVAPPLATWVKLDLSATVIEGRDWISLGWEYRAELFDHETVSSLAGAFHTLLAGALTEPDVAVGRLSPLSEADRGRLTRDWARGPVRSGDLAPLHTWFEAQARRAPDAVALVWAGGTLTYADLNRAATRLARSLRRRLRDRALTSGWFAALLQDRGPEVVISMLAVSKAGGAFAPLDLRLPDARLRTMLADLGPALLLTNGRSREAVIRLGAGQDVVEVDVAGTEAADEATDAARAVSADEIAYVIYTSGSTGRPKGVLVPHHAASNHMRWLCAALGLDSDDRVLSRTNLGFDASLSEIFAPLFAGAQVVVSGADAGGLTLIPDEIRTYGVTVLQTVPSLLDVLLTQPGGLQGCGTLRTMLCGGERLDTHTVRRCREQTRAMVINVYGPTEAAIDATCQACDPDSLAGPTVPIGRPIDNVSVYLLDDDLQPVPAGVVGEVYIGGAALARGYLGRPGLTAASFVPDPWAARPGSRMYRTGDRGRHFRDGRIQFLGRGDDQVKVRGHRIELGEIVRALSEMPGVAEAAVVLIDGPSGPDRRLVAYVTAVDEGRLAVEDLRHRLSESLPAYMVPSAFVQLPALPKLPSGKLDRRSLPLPGTERPDLHTRYEAPTGPLQEALGAMWADVLGVERPGANDNFFTLGGHSLLALRIVARIADTLGVEVPLRQLFEAPTIASLAAAIAEQRQARARAEAVVDALGPAQRRALLQSLDQLSDAEVDALLDGVDGRTDGGTEPP